jgi:hypothetical protein
MLYSTMTTVLRLNNIRVVIYTNDHPPAHVHAVRGNKARAKFVLNCPHGPVGLIERAVSNSLRSMKSVEPWRHYWGKYVGNGVRFMAEFKTVSETEFTLKTITHDKIPAFVAQSATFDPVSKTIAIALSNGISAHFPIGLFPELRAAKADDLHDLHIEGQGYGLHIPALDADISVAQLFKDYLASDVMLKKLNRQKASRANGQKGGRPTKAA